MTIWSDIGFPDVKSRLQQAWAAVEDPVSSAIGDGMQAVEVIVGALVLIALLPVIAHAALACLLMILGAPVWFIGALFL